MERKEKELGRIRRKMRVRKKIQGTADRPRLCVFKSSRHIYAQVVDDSRSHTLAAASTLSPELKGKKMGPGKMESARQVGALIGQKMVTLGVQKVSFDRNGYLYHGRVKALADAAREKGIEF